MTKKNGKDPQDKPPEDPKEDPQDAPADDPKPEPKPEPKEDPKDQFEPDRLQRQLDGLKDKYGEEAVNKFLAQQSGSVAPAEFEQLREEFGETKIELTREKLANRLNISEETAAKIPGSTPDEIIQNAEFAAEFAAEQTANKPEDENDPNSARYNLSNRRPPASDLSPEDELKAAQADLRKAFD